MLDAPDEATVDVWLEQLLRGESLRLGRPDDRRGGAATAGNGGARSACATGPRRHPLERKHLDCGPKPGQALKEIGITPTRIAPVPTTDGVIEALRQEALGGLNVGVTLAGVPNVPLVDFLVGRPAAPSIHRLCLISTRQRRTANGLLN